METGLTMAAPPDDPIRVIQEQLERALVTHEIAADLIALDKADWIVRIIAEQIDRHQRLADRLKWFLGDYYNALRTRYSREEIANALQPLIGSSISIDTIEDYAATCRRIGSDQRHLFESIQAAHELTRRSISYARQELEVPTTQMRRMTKARMEVEERAAQIRNEVLAALKDDPEPITNLRAIEAIERFVREINPIAAGSHVQITHRVQRPPLTIQYAEETILSSPIGAIQGAMSALEYMSRLIRSFGLRGQRVPIRLQLQNPRTGYEYRFEFEMVVPQSAGDPYHIEAVRCEEIQPADFYEETDHENGNANDPVSSGH